MTTQTPKPPLTDCFTGTERENAIAPLFHKWSTCLVPQEAHICLDLQNGRVFARHEPRIGGAAPLDVCRGLLQRFTVANDLTGKETSALIQELWPLLSRVYEGSRLVQNPSGLYGFLNEDAQDAVREIDYLCVQRKGTANIQSACEHLAGGDPRNVTLDELVRPDETREDAALRLQSEAAKHRVHVYGIEDFLDSLYYEHYDDSEDDNEES